MDDYDLELSRIALRQELQARGCHLGEVAVRSGDHRVLVEVDNVFMFSVDALDVVAGRATVAEVQLLNVGAVFPASHCA